MPRTTTNSPAAASAIEEGMRAWVHWRTDAMQHVDAAIEADPGCALAHAVKGLALVTGRNEAYRPRIEAALEAARAFATDVTPRERLYVEALEAMAAGRLTDAIVCYEKMLAGHPTDLLAQRLVQQEMFWMGEARWMADIAERTAPAWTPDTPDYGMFLSIRAFSLEEAGERDRAEALAREAVERDPGDCWGAHAVAHVLVMQGRIDDGVAWLEGLSGNWAGKSQIVHHLWWHLCLFLLERGEHARILDLLDREVRNPDSPLVQAVPDAYIDLQNVASLLLRLELRGVDVGARWESVADAAQGRIGNHASPFTDAHAAMILAGAGRAERADALLASMREFAAADTGTLGPRYRAAAIPAATAAVAHRRGDHEAVVAALLPARHSLWQMGGSHAQRDVFTQILVDSARRLGMRDFYPVLLDEVRASGFAAVDRRTLYAEVA